MNIVIIIADSLRRDTSDSIVAFPKNLPLTEYKVTSCNSCTELSMPWMLSGMEPFSPTMSIPTDMKKRGYHTVMIHSNPIVQRFARPFDQVIDLGNKDPIKQRVKRWHRLTRHIPMWLYKRVKTNKNYLPYARVQQKLEAYKSLDKSKPLFVWLHLMDPHTPYYPRATDLPLEHIIEVNRKHISTVRGYYKPSKNLVDQWYDFYRLESTEMYWYLLEFFDTLDYTENTIIFTSDHGEEFGEHGEYGHKGNRFNPENIDVPFFIIGKKLGNISISSHKELRRFVKNLK